MHAGKILMVMRPYQVYAVEALITSGNAYNPGMRISWHTTGAGKTLTSLRRRKSLQQIRTSRKSFSLVDRKDLDSPDNRRV